ncbi:MAG: type III-B CRISPR module RAMP protein Cmr4 [Bacteroidia bacterium]|nr:type III-B CRISPR module RAMP protein Cmr4 [Bacteroidia bacterium]
MSKKGFILWLFTETPLHAGMGSGLGEVDLPLQRERTTGLPFIQASGIKGALRAHLTAQGSDKETLKALFGPDTESAHEHAGALAVSDARLLLFPVRSLAGVWAWTTAPMVWERLRRDIERFKTNGSSSSAPASLGEKIDKPIVKPKAPILLQDSKLILEDMAYEVSHTDVLAQVGEWLTKNAFEKGSYWEKELQNHLAVLPDEEFEFFTENATEVITRVRIDQATKTVQEGALWTEELLPSETLLYVAGIVEDSHERKTENGNSLPLYEASKLLEKIREYTDEKRLQLGGDSTLGRGWCYAKLMLL